MLSSVLQESDLLSYRCLTILSAGTEAMSCFSQGSSRAAASFASSRIVEASFSREGEGGEEEGGGGGGGGEGKDDGGVATVQMSEVQGEGGGGGGGGGGGAGMVMRSEDRFPYE